MLPEKETAEPEKLQFITADLLSTAELSLLQARKEIALFGERCLKQFGYLLELHNIEKDDDFNAKLEKVKRYEDLINPSATRLAR